MGSIAQINRIMRRAVNRNDKDLAVAREFYVPKAAAVYPTYKEIAIVDRILGLPTDKEIIAKEIGGRLDRPLNVKTYK